MIETFQTLGLDFNKVAKRDQRFVDEMMAEAEKLCTAYREAPRSDLSRYQAAKAAQAFALRADQHLLLPQLAVPFNQAQLEPSGDPPAPDQTIYGSEVCTCDVIAKGHGTWWGDEVDQYGAATITFSFIPSQTTVHRFKGTLSFVGYSFLVADHEWNNNKGAGNSMCLSSSITQFFADGSETTVYGYDQNQEWFQHCDNGAVLLPVNLSVPIEFNTPLYANYKVTLTLLVIIEAAATGGGSLAELNFKSKPGDGIYCPSIVVSSM